MGMVIEYCRTCRERIDPQDFKNGQALAWKGQCYCANCKEPVLAKLANDPEYQAQQRAAAKEAHRSGSGRVEAVADRGTGRRHHGSGSYGPQGPNKTLLLVGAGGGVLALAVVGLLVMGNSSPGSGGSGSSKPTTTAKATTSKGGGPKNPASVATPTGPAEESPAEKLRRRQVEEQVRGKFEAIKKFARENPDDFAELDLKWKNFIEDDIWKDPIVIKSEDLSKLRGEAEAERKRQTDLLDSGAKEEAERLVSRATIFAKQGNFRAAYAELDRFPMKYRNSEHYKKVQECRDQIAKMEQSTHVDFPFGQWVTVYDGTEAACARWAVDGGGAISYDAEAKAMVVKGGSRPGTLIFQAPQKEAWADYEVDMEVQPFEGCQFGFRCNPNPNTGRLEGTALQFDADDAKSFDTYKLKVQDANWTVEETGQEPVTRQTQFLRGFTLFIMQPGKELRLKSFKIRVTKVLR